MAKKLTPKITINLSSRGKQTVGKVVYGWTIDAGRAIIVGIELIALLALGYRFVIDRQIVDLHDEIERQERLIGGYANDEKTFRSIQDRLQNIKLTNEDTSSKVQIMNEILKAITSGTFFSTNLSISNSSILVDGSTFSPYILSDFLNGLKSYPSITAISIEEISSSDVGVQFKARIDIKQSTPTL